MAVTKKSAKDLDAERIAAEDDAEAKAAQDKADAAEEAADNDRERSEAEKLGKQSDDKNLAHALTAKELTSKDPQHKDNLNKSDQDNPAPQGRVRSPTQQPEYVYLDLTSLSSYVDMQDNAHLYQKADAPFRMLPKKALMLKERMDDRGAPIFKDFVSRPPTPGRFRRHDPPTVEGRLPEGSGDMSLQDLRHPRGGNVDTAAQDDRKQSLNRTGGVEV